MPEIYSADVGAYVCCDFCDTDLTDDPRAGGFIFSGKGAGPCCAARVMGSVERAGEQEYIQGQCPPEMSFADWVRGVRGSTAGGSRITIVTDWPWQTADPDGNTP